MKFELKVFDMKEQRFVESHDELMQASGQDPRMGYGSLGLQEGGLPIVCDACGSFGYLDAARYRVDLLV